MCPLIFAAPSKPFPIRFVIFRPQVTMNSLIFDVIVATSVDGSEQKLLFHS